MADVEQLLLEADLPLASQRIFRDSTSLALMIDLTMAHADGRTGDTRPE